MTNYTEKEMKTAAPCFIVLMGVSGSGKTTVGQMLAAELGWSYFDADDYHPEANIEKMSRGEPLTDEDRWPWLDKLSGLIETNLEVGNSGVLGCSALKGVYRERLRREDGCVRFVYLQGSFELIYERMTARADHFMEAQMLRSQFAALEAPTAEEALIVSIDQTPAEIVAEILERGRFT